MDINAKIAKVPFFVLYLILAVCTSFNWISVILFQKDFAAFQTEQPWDYYLSIFFANTFGITQRQYFIFALPIVLLGLYVIPKAVGKLMSLDKSSNVKGDNHVATILILLVAPATLGLHSLVPGVIMIFLFSIWSWADEKNKK